MSNFIVNTDIPNLKVVIREGDAYNINIVPGRINTIRTGSFTSYADMAGLAASASYISGSNVFAESSSYAITASYAENLADISAFPYSGSGVITGSLLMLDTADQGGITGSLYGTASVADGIDVIFAGTFETGSEGVIIPSPSGGLTYINSASYALTASYLDNNTWENISNIPEGLLSSSVQVFYIPVESASYAVTSSYTSTASYAFVNPLTTTQNYPFQIPFLSASNLTVDVGPHLIFNPITHILQISGGSGVGGGVAQISPRGMTLYSGSNVETLALNLYGLQSKHDGKTIGLAALPVSSSPFIADVSEPGIFVTSGSFIGSAYVPLQFQGSGSYTDGRVTANKKFVAKEGIEVTGSFNITGSFVLPTEESVSPQIGSMYFSGSFIYVYDGTQYRSASLA